MQFNLFQKPAVFIFGKGPNQDLSKCITNGTRVDKVLSVCENCPHKENCGLRERLELAKTLVDNLLAYPKIVELILAEGEPPETLVSSLIPYKSMIDQLEDQIIYRQPEDPHPLIIILPKSLGSVAEFEKYYNSNLKQRMRLVLEKKFSPFHNEEMSYASSRYHTFAADVGHLYVYTGEKEKHLVVRRIVEGEIKMRLPAQKDLNNKNNLYYNGGEIEVALEKKEEQWEDIDKITYYLGLLAHKTRAAIMKILYEANREISFTGIYLELFKNGIKVTKSQLAYHLNTLNNASLIDQRYERRGKTMSVYKISDLGKKIWEKAKEIALT